MQTQHIGLNQPYVYFTHIKGKSPAIELYLLIPIQKSKRIIFHPPTKNESDYNSLTIICELVDGKDKNVIRVGTQNFGVKTFHDDERITFQSDDPENFGITVLVKDEKNTLGEVSLLYKDADRLHNKLQKPELERFLAINCPYISITQLDKPTTNGLLKRYEPSVIIVVPSNTTETNSEHLTITSGRVGVCESIIVLEKRATDEALKLFVPSEVNSCQVNYLDEKEGGFSAITYLASKQLESTETSSNLEDKTLEFEIEDNLSEEKTLASDNKSDDSIPSSDNRLAHLSREQFNRLSPIKRRALFLRLNRLSLQDDQLLIREVRLRPKPKSADNLPKEAPDDQSNKPTSSS